MRKKLTEALNKYQKEWDKYNSIETFKEKSIIERKINAIKEKLNELPSEEKGGGGFNWIRIIIYVSTQLILASTFYGQPLYEFEHDIVWPLSRVLSIGSPKINSVGYFGWGLMCRAVISQIHLYLGH